MEFVLLIATLVGAFAIIFDATPAHHAPQVRQPDRLAALLDGTLRVDPGWFAGLGRAPAVASESAEDLPLRACSSCHTVHHAERLEEAGGCTVFGCGGGRRAGERVR